MGLLNRFKKKVSVEVPVKSQTPEQRLSISHVVRRHEGRISNLEDEIETLSESLKMIELETDTPRASKSKKSDAIIRRMTLIRYEVNIRSNLLKWL